MDIRELRIGNFIYSKGQSHNENGQFLGWVNYEIIVDLEVLTNIHTNNEDFAYSPIPLTEEILLKAGFENNDGEKYNPDDEYAEQFKYTLKSGIFYRDFECTPYKGWFVSIGDYNNENIKFEYLHHLQNIIFDLTGEEIKL